LVRWQIKISSVEHVSKDLPNTGVVPKLFWQQKKYSAMNSASVLENLEACRQLKFLS
jgi:hypothetical protein